jgi:predicted ABC-type transport system involved in lysophospholipase L1 biosynthesis ATPase subunit
MTRVARLAGVRRVFADGARRREVLRGVDLEVEAGALVALVGPSGCGKTTLLSILGALDAGFEGQAEVLGRALETLSDDARAALRSQELGFVFQSFHLLDHLSVAENVEVPLWLAPARLGRDEERRRAQEALQRVGLGDRLDERVPTLSGGERQRVAIARALVNRPKLLLADEPTGNLDSVTGAAIYDIFERIRRGEDGNPGCAVVIATHDPRLSTRVDRLLRVQDGLLAPEAEESAA